MCVLGTLLLASCGGSDEGPTPEQQVREALSGWFTTLDVDARCERAVSQRFLREVYGDQAACRRAEAPHPDARPLAETALAGRTTLRGQRGAVVARFKGGRTDLIHGRVELAHERSRWRIDALSPGLLRDIFTRTTFDQVQLTAERPGLRLTAAQKCVFFRFQEYSDEEVRRMGYAAIGQRAGRERLAEPILGCLNAPRTGPQGMSYLRWHLLAELLAPARDRKARRCIRVALTKRVTGAEVLEHVQRAGGTPPATRKIARLVSRCGG